MRIKISWNKLTQKYRIRIVNGPGNMEMVKEFSYCKNALKFIDSYIYTGARLYDDIDNQYYAEMKQSGYIFQDLKGE